MIDKDSIKAAFNGSPTAQFYVGDIIKRSNWGQEITSSETIEDSRRMFELSLRGGYIQSASKLLEFKYNNEESLFNIYKLAAERGRVKYYIPLAKTYYEGAGTEVDHAKAFRWFLEAAKHNEDKWAWYSKKHPGSEKVLY